MFDGSYKWYSRGDQHGGFEIGGTLRDLDKSNGRGVKFQVKVEGYAPDVYTAATDRDVTVPDLVHFTGDQQLVVRAGYQTCQVNTVLPDDCEGYTYRVNPYK